MRVVEVRCDGQHPDRLKASCGALLFRIASTSRATVELRCWRCRQTTTVFHTADTGAVLTRSC